MNIDWMNFTPASALAGGFLIGLSAALLLVLSGRIAGISGIVGGLLQHRRGAEIFWRSAFVAGLVGAPILYAIFGHLPESDVEVGWLQLVAAGLLVGFGTRLGSGCTSGHGVCGISRLSPRSIVATLIFMGTGFLTVFVSHHLFA